MAMFCGSRELGVSGVMRCPRQLVMNPVAIGSTALQRSSLSLQRGFVRLPFGFPLVEKRPTEEYVEGRLLVDLIVD